MEQDNKFQLVQQQILELNLKLEDLTSLIQDLEQGNKKQNIEFNSERKKLLNVIQSNMEELQDKTNRVLIDIRETFDTSIFTEINSRVIAINKNFDSLKNDISVELNNTLNVNVGFITSELSIIDYKINEISNGLESLPTNDSFSYVRSSINQLQEKFSLFCNKADKMCTSNDISAVNEEISDLNKNFKQIEKLINSSFLQEKSILNGIEHKIDLAFQKDLTEQTKNLFSSLKYSILESLSGNNNNLNSVYEGLDSLKQNFNFLAGNLDDFAKLDDIDALHDSLKSFSSEIVETTSRLGSSINAKIQQNTDLVANEFVKLEQKIENLSKILSERNDSEEINAIKFTLKDIQDGIRKLFENNSQDNNAAIVLENIENSINSLENATKLYPEEKQQLMDFFNQNLKRLDFKDLLDNIGQNNEKIASNINSLATSIQFLPKSQDFNNINGNVLNIANNLEQVRNHLSVLSSEENNSLARLENKIDSIYQKDYSNGIDTSLIDLKNSFEQKQVYLSSKIEIITEIAEQVATIQQNQPDQDDLITLQNEISSVINNLIKFPKEVEYASEKIKGLLEVNNHSIDSVARLLKDAKPFLEKANARLDSNILYFNEQIKNITDSIKLLDNRALVQQIEKLNEEMSFLTGNFRDLAKTEDIDELKDSIKVINLDLIDLSKGLNSSLINHLDTSKQHLIDEISAMADHLKYTTEHISVQLKETSKSQEIEHLNNNILRITDNLNELKSGLNTILSEENVLLDSLNNNINALPDKNLLNTSIDELKVEITQSFQQNKEHISFKISDNINQLKQIIESLAVKIEDCSKTKHVEDVNNSIDTINNQLIEIKDSLNNVYSEEKSLLDNISQKISTLADADSIQETINQLNELKNELVQSIKGLSSDVNLTAKLTDVEKVSCEIIDLNEEINELKFTLNSIFTDERSILNVIESKINNLPDINSVLSANSLIKNLQQDINSSQQYFSEKLESLEEISSQIASFQQTLPVQSDIYELRNDLHSISSGFAGVPDEINIINSRLAEFLTANNSSNELIYTDIQEIKPCIEKANTRLDSNLIYLNEQIQNLFSKIDYINNQEVLENIDGLNSKIEGLFAQNNRSIDSINELIEELNPSLESVNLKIDSNASFIRDELNKILVRVNATDDQEIIENVDALNSKVESLLIQTNRSNESILKLVEELKPSVDNVNFKIESSVNYIHEQMETISNQVSETDNSEAIKTLSRKIDELSVQNNHSKDVIVEIVEELKPSIDDIGSKLDSNIVYINEQIKYISNQINSIEDTEVLDNISKLGNKVEEFCVQNNNSNEILHGLVEAIHPSIMNINSKLESSIIYIDDQIKGLHEQVLACDTKEIADNVDGLNGKIYALDIHLQALSESLELDKEFEQIKTITNFIQDRLNYLTSEMSKTEEIQAVLNSLDEVNNKINIIESQINNLPDINSTMEISSKLDNLQSQLCQKQDYFSEKLDNIEEISSQIAVFQESMPDKSDLTDLKNEVINIASNFSQFPNEMEYINSRLKDFLLENNQSNEAITLLVQEIKPFIEKANSKLESNVLYINEQVKSICDVVQLLDNKPLLENIDNLSGKAEIILTHLESISTSAQLYESFATIIPVLNAVQDRLKTIISQAASSNEVQTVLTNLKNVNENIQKIEYKFDCIKIDNEQLSEIAKKVATYSNIEQISQHVASVNDTLKFLFEDLSKLAKSQEILEVKDAIGIFNNQFIDINGHINTRFDENINTLSFEFGALNLKTDEINNKIDTINSDSIINTINEVFSEIQDKIDSKFSNNEKLDEVKNSVEFVGLNLNESIENLNNSLQNNAENLSHEFAELKHNNNEQLESVKQSISSIGLDLNDTIENLHSSIQGHSEKISQELIATKQNNNEKFEEVKNTVSSIRLDLNDTIENLHSSIHGHNEKISQELIDTKQINNEKFEEVKNTVNFFGSTLNQTFEDFSLTLTTNNEKVTYELLESKLDSSKKLEEIKSTINLVESSLNEAFENFNNSLQDNRDTAFPLIESVESLKTNIEIILNNIEEVAKVSDIDYFKETLNLFGSRLSEHLNNFEASISAKIGENKDSISYEILLLESKFTDINKNLKSLSDQNQVSILSNNVDIVNEKLAKSIYEQESAKEMLGYITSLNDTIINHISNILAGLQNNKDNISHFEEPIAELLKTTDAFKHNFEEIFVKFPELTVGIEKVYTSVVDLENFISRFSQILNENFKSIDLNFIEIKNELSEIKEISQTSNKFDHLESLIITKDSKTQSIQDSIMNLAGYTLDSSKEIKATLAEISKSGSDLSNKLTGMSSTSEIIKDSMIGLAEWIDSAGEIFENVNDNVESVKNVYKEQKDNFERKLRNINIIMNKVSEKQVLFEESIARIEKKIGLIEEKQNSDDDRIVNTLEYIATKVSATIDGNNLIARRLDYIEKYISNHGKNETGQ